MSQEARWVKLLEDGEPIFAGSKICGFTPAGRASMIERLQAIIDRRMAREQAIADAELAANVPALQPSGTRGRWTY